MRKDLYRKNYQLLKRFVPEMLVSQAPEFSLSHRGELDSRVKTYARKQTIFYMTGLLLLLKIRKQIQIISKNYRFREFNRRRVTEPSSWLR